MQSWGWLMWKWGPEGAASMTRMSVLLRFINCEIQSQDSNVSFGSNTDLTFSIFALLSERRIPG